MISISLLEADKINNTLEVNGELIYFSTKGQINSKYFINNKYKDIIKQYYISITKNEHKDVRKDIDLPDSLGNNYMKIKKGYKAVKINSPLMTHAAIKGFKLTPNDFSSTPRVIMSLSDSAKCNWNDLFLISQKSSTLELITSNPLMKSQETTIYQSLQGIIVNFFIKNRKIYKHQMDYRNNHLDSLNNLELEEDIVSKFDFQFFKIDEGTYLVNGKTLSDWDNPFIALISENNEVTLKSTARLLNSFNILNTQYFFCADFKSGSGLSVKQVFSVKDNRYEIVFEDWSDSN